MSVRSYYKKGSAVAAGDTDQTADVGTEDQELVAAFDSAMDVDLGSDAAALGDLVAVLTVPSGEVNATLEAVAAGELDEDLGIDAQSYGDDLAARVSFPAGTDGQDFGDAIVALLLVGGVGTDDQSLAVTPTGVGTEDIGVDDQADAWEPVGAPTIDVGGDDASFCGASSATTGSHPTSHTITQDWSGHTHNNANDWANVTNAYDESLGNATISAAAGALQADWFNDQINFADFGLSGDVPAGWTRSAVEVETLYGFDFTFSHIALGHDWIRIWLVENDTAPSTFVQSLRDQQNINGTEGLTRHNYDVTAAVNALTAAQIEALGVAFSVDVQIPAAGGNASVTLDFVRIDMTFTRTEIDCGAPLTDTDDATIADTDGLALKEVDA